MFKFSSTDFFNYRICILYNQPNSVGELKRTFFDADG